MDDIWRLNHEIYCEELNQHATASSKRRVDSKHKEGVFFVAKVDQEIVGMISLTPKGHQLSTMKRIPAGLIIDRGAHEMVEVRLLAIHANYRGRGIYDHLILAVMEYCRDHRVDSVIISAIGKQDRLYSMMGFVNICEPVIEGSCRIQPMILARDRFEESWYRRKRLSRIAGK
ncbi:GNAT family N-acetyltransferase [Stenotrophomonas sp. SORGH_AS_0321]|uniref:GNAT family N-acetyltransferase n=1 Tax=Stenotrophomonas sp. SORGH_AS_0321 TaxID=3041787 RepID=UPI00285B195F|nr:GNAT superfamily N-acetyltransferase [Stenotrophomonas sp. SORGH_AS_0321]